MAFTGLFVPLITPLTATGDLAGDALEALSHAVLTDGATGLVALGTTGEPATLTTGERRRVLDICKSVCKDRNAPLIVGAGSNSTAQSTEALAELGAGDEVSAALVVVPYYTRPSEDGVVEHFRRLAAASPVPLIIYNIPYRTGRTLSAETLLRLAELPNVAGFKHAVGGIDADTIEFMTRLPDDVSVLAGDDLYAGPMLALGASGGILASAHLATRRYADLIAAWQQGAVTRARELGRQLTPLTQALFAEPNPVITKAVLAAEGRIPTGDVRLPLLPAAPNSTATALEQLADLEVVAASK
ncbi:4-hydroxy-tetrahydrodipicolinate synthase [Kribbella sandramycini]|uniref:4-hydroxy-tetrahydrodipicolinate synthase n=1 Tax=Kribbella sandramycini TaxID=60450 RepID=A0A7Y4P3A2_9ACTN|nr:4-hydroxy-tetrahydrodipicolinate synthase [Kribbella sandramycini]MBB6570209.1 4-hydroxy-tetrahydrodipicolinate synthase [Kribbella sandramycini]NOL45666.1 4-hydroxy-tetrahydrodipicolinate synthase [Kribbella sandramycini]